MKTLAILLFIGVLSQIQGKKKRPNQPGRPIECLKDINGNCIDLTTGPPPPALSCFEEDVIFVEGNINQIPITIEQCQQFCNNGLVPCKVR